MKSNNEIGALLLDEHARMYENISTLTTQWIEDAGLPFLDLHERSQGDG